MRRTIVILSAASALAFAGVAAAQTTNPAGNPDSSPPSTTGPASTPAAGPLGGAVNPPAPPPATPATAPNDTTPAPSPAAPSADTTGANTTATVPAAPVPAGHATGFLARGQMVRDSNGRAIGRITRFDDSNNQTTAVIRMGGHDITVPMSSLHAEGAGAVSSQTRAELQGSAQASSAPAAAR
jgi:hypothetical protein